jgi:hypothetical protein
MLNNSGLSEHPCFTPRSHAILSELPLLFSITDVAPLYRSATMFIVYLGKFRCFIVDIINS